MAEAASSKNDIHVETQADGSVVVDLNVRRRRADTKQKLSDHNANLAELLPNSALSDLSAELIEGVDADIAGRQEWVDNYNEGLKLLGILMEKPGIDQKSSRSRHPILTWAIVRFQSQARGEMLPTTGPCKIRNDDEKNFDPVKSDAIENDFNHYYTVTASEYYPDTDRGLFYLGYGGTIYKKVYWCPLRDRPVSEAVYLPDLIISNNTTDMENAARITHRMEMSQQQVKRFIDASWFADVPLMPPTPSRSTSQTAVGEVTGIKATVARQADYPHTLYETYVGRDFTPYDMGEKGQPEGIHLPYVVTLDRDSRQIYSVRRNWRESDLTRAARRRFVKWGLIPGLGFLDLGYLNLLGNHALTLTALQRILVDAGIYSIWPGGVRAKGARMESNEIRPGPGEFPEIDTGGQPISNAIMALPFKGPAAEVLALLQHLEEEGEKLSGQVEVPTGAGLSNVPVGTIMAAIDQQAQPQIAVHQRLHHAQGQEMLLMKELFVENPERGMELLTQADAKPVYTIDDLANAAVVPASDPNTPAHVHRIMQGTVLEMLSQAHPDVYNTFEVQKGLLEIARIYNPERYLVPPNPQPPPPDPTMAIAMMQNEIEKQKLALKADDQKGKQQLDQRKQMLDEMMAQAKQQHEVAKADADNARKVADTQQDAKAHVQAAQLDAAGDVHIGDTQAKVDLTNAEADRESRERIAAGQDHTQLLIKGIEALNDPKPIPTSEDKKS